MFIKSVRLFCIAILSALFVFPVMPVAASNAKLAQSKLLSNGQFVYGPNVGNFDIKAYLNTNAAHLAPYADDLYGRAEYHSINPKVYLTLLEIHAQLVTTENSAALNNAFGLENGDFMVSFKNGIFGTSALQNTDFNAAADQLLGPFKSGLSGNFYIINLSNAKNHINLLATSNGLTQIRLRFKLDDNTDAVANYLKLYSGNAALADRPQLLINYTLP